MSLVFMKALRIVFHMKFSLTLTFAHGLHKIGSKYRENGHFVVIFNNILDSIKILFNMYMIISLVIMKALSAENFEF